MTRLAGRLARPECLLAIAAIALGTSAAHAATPFPLGVFVDNPDATTPANEQAFETKFNGFVSLMGAAPIFMNAFVDYTQFPPQWPSNANWTAWSWSTSPVVGTAITPVIGVPMSDNAHWSGGPTGSTSDDFFKQIVAGVYDADYKGIVDAWAGFGYNTMYLRLGWEMDLGCFPWFMGSDSATQADWIAAFQHLATLMRNEAITDGARALVVWNPDESSWTALSVGAAYPGDAFVDVIAVDNYSPVYPTSLYDWSLNNWTYDATLKAWWKNVVNRRHFWTYPSANGWNPHGTGSGWGMQDAIALAQKHKKPFAISETGAGGDGSSTGPVDEPAFPAWLAGQLAGAERRGVRIAYVNIWDAWLSDGNWSFSAPGDSKPREAAAWVRWFGAPVASARSPASGG